MTHAVVFLILVFGITWSIGFYVASLPAPRSLLELLTLFVPQVWAPTLIAVVIVLITEGGNGVRTEIVSLLSYRRGSAKWLALAATLPAAMTVMAVVIARAAGDASAFTPVSALPVSIGLQLITGAVGEELGWRGFLLSRLGNRLGALRAAWAMGVLWSVWHIPAWFTPWLPHPTFPLVPNLLFIACFGVFLAFVFNRAGETVIPTMAAHLSLNITTAVGGVQLSSLVFWTTLAVMSGVVAIVASTRMMRPASLSHADLGGLAKSDRRGS